ncbi:hypothetical protein [Brachybacterium sp. GPGPB12]|uniref:hypothetical protein n=1 Tax=Brachybacterium sp. GPGPB12 TaxID=3023517 RepID=UPI0031345FD5
MLGGEDHIGALAAGRRADVSLVDRARARSRCRGAAGRSEVGPAGGPSGRVVRARRRLSAFGPAPDRSAQSASPMTRPVGAASSQEFSAAPGTRSTIAWISRRSSRVKASR